MATPLLTRVGLRRHQLRIELPFPPATLSGHANGNGRWKKIGLTKQLREQARRITSELGTIDLPPAGDIAIDVLFVPPDKRGDRWNYPARAKAQIDGIADALGVNDKRFLPTIRHAEPCKPGKVVVTIGGE